MVKISAVVVTFNEEKNIERCLSSLNDIADEIIILDSFSTDNTKTICDKFNAKFYQSKFEGHGVQKNKANEYTTNPIVLSLDADEVLSPELRQSIINIKENWAADGYFFNRLTSYCGKWIKHSGWYPDKKLRLWDKRKGEWGGFNPHNIVEMQPDAKIGYLKGDLLHYSYFSKEEFISRTKKYARESAESLFKAGKKYSFLKLIFAPIWRFFKNYFLALSFLHGYEGFLISRMMAKGVYLKYFELSKLYKNKTK